MRYDILQHSASRMPSLGKGTESIKILLKMASNDIQKPLVPLFFPIFYAHISDAYFTSKHQVEGLQRVISALLSY